MYVKSTTGGCDVEVRMIFFFVEVEVHARLPCAGGGRSRGPFIGRNLMSVSISLDTPTEKAVSCSWMYMRKVSERQRPIFRIWMSLQLFRCMAMAPPARREWLLMSPLS